jgi:SHS2 domain-containing protein
MGIQDQKDGFFEIPHSADLALEVRAASLPGLFLMRMENHGGRQVSRKMVLQEIDLENLLVSFLNELLVDVQQNGKVYENLQLEINHFSLKGNMIGKKNCSFGRELKAVTYHDLKIIKITSGYKTAIVFDI